MTDLFCSTDLEELQMFGDSIQSLKGIETWKKIKDSYLCGQRCLKDISALRKRRVLAVTKGFLQEFEGETMRGIL